MSNSLRCSRVNVSPDVISYCGHESYYLSPISEAAKAWSCRYLPANWDYDFKFQAEENRYDLSCDHYEYTIKKMKSAGFTIAEFGHPGIFEELLQILDEALGHG